MTRDSSSYREPEREVGDEPSASRSAQTRWLADGPGRAMTGGRLDAARRFAAQLRTAAGGRGLRRTLMRGLALSTVLEQRASESPAAAGHLEAFLRLFAETPCARPSIREREACAAVVTAFLESGAESPHRETAQSLVAAMKRVDAVL